MNSFTQFINTLGVVRIAALAAVAIAVMAFFLYVVTRFAAPNMSLLYGDLSVEDSSQMVTKLEAMGEPYQISGNGTQILVSADRVLRLRMAMAEDGVPSGGSVGYEVFDRSSGIGASNFVQNVNRLRSLEGELARTIRTLATVHAARVHLVLPQRQLFSRERLEPSASIVLQLGGGTELSRGQVTAIQYLVAAAVPSLNPRRVSIVDSRGNLLARGSGDTEEEQASAGNSNELQHGYERRLSRKIEELLERSLGPSTVRAQVSADMDFDRVSTNEEIYDPDSQVVRSTQTVEESNNSQDGRSSSPAVSVADDLPGPEDDGAGDSENSASNSNRTEETVNYEISRVVKSHIRESGTVRRLSVAVLVDGRYGEPDADGVRAYQPRDQKELDQLTALVRSAIGYDEARGDTVEVVNLQFATTDPSALEEAAMPLVDLDKSDYFRIGEIIILLISAVLAILFVVRPLLKRLLEMTPPSKPAGDGQNQITDQSVPALEGPEQGSPPVAQEDVEEDNGSRIDMDQVEGRVKESSYRKVGEIVQNHPEETVSIIRNWMFNEE